MKYIMVNEVKIVRAKQKVKSGDALAIFKEYNKLGGRIVDENSVQILNEDVDISKIEKSEVFQHEAVIEKKKAKVVVKATSKKEVKEEK